MIVCWFSYCFDMTTKTKVCLFFTWFLVKVCIYPRVKVCIYPRVKVCIYPRVKICIYPRVKECIYPRVKVCIYPRVKVCIYPSVKVCIYPRVKVCIYPSVKVCISNQIKSNHFYCHITTAQVPWWVKFLRACSRQCKKKKQFTYGQYIFTDCTEDNVQNTHTYTQYT